MVPSSSVTSGSAISGLFKRAGLSSLSDENLSGRFLYDDWKEITGFVALSTLSDWSKEGEYYGINEEVSGTVNVNRLYPLFKNPKNGLTEEKSTITRQIVEDNGLELVGFINLDYSSGNPAITGTITSGAFEDSWIQSLMGSNEYSVFSADNPPPLSSSSQRRIKTDMKEPSLMLLLSL